MGWTDFGWQGRWDVPCYLCQTQLERRDPDLFAGPLIISRGCASDAAFSAAWILVCHVISDIRNETA